MCEVCKQGKPLKDEDRNHICIDGKMLYVYIDKEFGHMQQYEINYCPICGEKLKQE